ncbi:DUF5050 domain-containing protein [Paenibacillus donghaensis]|uniref:Prolow-density lipoprotein receptor-related protein 1-like beta-propeller domain-containing protein n=1 Tax=Paenibacillus donghaensis TaxID=414771 RepID=A0A2Z2KHC7_9BACL|nr:DUF5050 domain-containing protein [Paenibacillus donghaensis]ASA25644.1 hypothetical protein B9T62_35890 [Paenibacillus donghaensis]
MNKVVFIILAGIVLLTGCGGVNNAEPIDKQIEETVESQSIEYVKEGSFRDGQHYGFDVNNNLFLADELVLDNVKEVYYGDADGYFLILTNSGELYGLGQSIYGVLGNGHGGYQSTNDYDNYIETTPYKIMEQVDTFSAVRKNVLALTKSGDLYGWGINTSGEVGNGESSLSARSEIIKPVLEPTLIMNKIKEFKLGEEENNYYNVLAVTDLDELYVWGRARNVLEMGTGKGWEAGVQLFSPQKRADNVISYEMQGNGVFVTLADGKSYLLNDTNVNNTTGNPDYLFSSEDILWDVNKGNSQTNLVNRSRLVEYDGWIYQNYRGRLARVRIDGSDFEELLDMKGQYKLIENFSAIDNKVYFLAKDDHDDSSGLLLSYDIQTQKLSRYGMTYFYAVTKDEVILCDKDVSGLRIRKINNPSPTSSPDTIYKYERTINSFDFNDEGDLFLHSGLSILEQHDSDATVEKWESEGVTDFQITGDWIYFIKNNAVFRMKKDKSERSQVIFGEPVFNANGDFFYYVSDNDIYRLKVGSEDEPVKLNKDTIQSNVQYIYLLPSGLYFSDGFYYKLNFDGTIVNLWP